MSNLLPSSSQQGTKKAIPSHNRTSKKLKTEILAYIQ